MTANSMSPKPSDPMPDGAQEESPDQMSGADESLDSLVRKYKSTRLYLGDDGEIVKRKRDDYTDDPQPMEKVKRQPLTIMPVTENERVWGTLVYMLPILTLLLGGFTAGLIVPIMLIVSLWLFMSNQRSPYISQHARQALIIEAVGTLGWLAVLVGMPLVGAVLTIALALTIVGVVVIPILWLLIVVGLIASLVMPFSLLVFGVMGAWQAWQGRPFLYPIRIPNVRHWRGRSNGWRQRRNWTFEN